MLQNTLNTVNNDINKKDTVPKKEMNKKRRRRRRKSNDESSSTSSDSESREDENHHPINNQKNNRRGPRRGRCNKKRQVNYPKESDFVALDCEMVGIRDGHSSSVARVSVIDWDGKILLDEYIQQTEEVADYRTFVSGITKEDMEGANMTLEECRELVLQILHNHILVGHALKNDMKALGITHPWFLTRDTAKYEPFMKVRFNDGILWPRKLKDLAQEKLHQDIQVLGKPHSPIEDAQAALDLYRSVRPKWESAMAYKIEKTNQIQQKKQGLTQ